MARLTAEYIRKEFLRQFAHMSPDRREATIWALQVTHDTVLARDAPDDPNDSAEEAIPPLLASAAAE